MMGMHQLPRGAHMNKSIVASYFTNLCSKLSLLHQLIKLF